MKKVILGSFALILFSSSVLLFQISCQKSADAQAGGGNGSYTLLPATKSVLGGIIVGDGLAVSNTGVLSLDPAAGGGTGTTAANKVLFTKYDATKGSEEIWLMNYDGTGQTKVNIALPTGVEIGGDVHMSPDGKKLFFLGNDTNATLNKEDIYSCDINGSNVKKIYDMPASTGHTNLSGVY